VIAAAGHDDLRRGFYAPNHCGVHPIPTPQRMSCAIVTRALIADDQPRLGAAAGALTAMLEVASAASRGWSG
jgi:hypothetical protein